jgi:hypothetical protein
VTVPARNEPGRMRRHAVRALALVALVVACTPAPRPERSEAPTTATPAASEPVTRPPGSEAPPPEVTIELLPPQFVPSSALQSFGTEIVCTMGPQATSDVWAFVPGEAPRRLYENPRRDTFIPYVARSDRGYAFYETEDVLVGIGEWRVWFLPVGAAAPIPIDRGLAPNSGGPPGLAVDGRRLAWAGFEEPPGGPVGILRVVDLEHLDDVEHLLTMPIEDALFWYPTLDGDRLWYAAVDMDFVVTGTAEEFHIESMDLAAPLRRRDRFPGTANDFDPAVTPEHVAWKTVEPDYAPANWGALRILERATGREMLLGVDRAMSPSIGARYVAFEEITQSRLLLYDLVEERIVDVSGALPDGARAVSRQSVAGDLLTFMVAVEGLATPRLAWAWLPPR